MWNDICFAQNCAVLAFWTIFIITSSALTTWYLEFRGENEVSYFGKWIGLLTFIGTAFFQGMLMFIIYFWPSTFSLVLTAFWMLVVAWSLMKLFWKFVLEPLWFHGSQLWSRLTGA